MILDREGDDVPCHFRDFWLYYVSAPDKPSVEEKCFRQTFVSFGLHRVYHLVFYAKFQFGHESESLVENRGVRLARTPHA
jgi:hypothetical protein